MISQFRMRFDVFGQGIIIMAVALQLFFAGGFVWTNIILGLLIIWQLASAIHLLMVYRYIQRLHFIRTAIVLLISLPIWIRLVGIFAYLPVAGVAVWYFVRSIRDLIIVNKRPRSFWDLR